MLICVIKHCYKGKAIGVYTTYSDETHQKWTNDDKADLDKFADDIIATMPDCKLIVTYPHEYSDYTTFHYLNVEWFFPDES